MAIQVANLTAQVGADLTQFKMGMAEVAARLNQVESRAITAGHRIDSTRQRAQAATNDVAHLQNRAAALNAEATALGPKIAAARAAQAASVQALQVRAELAQNRGVNLRQTNATFQDRSTRAIENARNTAIVAEETARQLLGKAQVQLTAGHVEDARKTMAQAELQRNKQLENELKEAELMANEARRATDARRRIRLADERTRKAREAVDQARNATSPEVSRLETRQRDLTSRARIFSGRAGTRAADAAQFQTSIADQQRDADANREVAESYARRLAENAREHQVRAFNSVAAAATQAGTVIVGAFGAAIGTGSQYESMMLKAQHNTSLTAEGVAIMNKEVRRMGLESGASLDELAHGFQKVENFSFSASDAAKITEIAMRSAVATGSDMGQTAELLAKVMVQFGMSTDQANNAMNAMHTAANLSSLEMSELVSVGGQTFSMASNLGIGFVEANAALVTFTKMGLNAHEAMTQFRNDLQKLISPTKAVQDQFASIQKKSGVDIAKTFTLTSLKARGLVGAFADIREAASKMGVSVESLANKLFPNLRGTIGAMILSSDKGFNTFNETVAKVDEAFKGHVDPTTKQYEETLKSTTAQLGRAKNAMILLSDSVSKAMAPAVTAAANKLRMLVEGFLGLPQAEQASRAKFVLFVGVTLLAVGAVGKFIVGLASLQQALLSMTATTTVTAAFQTFTPIIIAARVATLAFMAAWAPWILLGVAIGATFIYLAKQVIALNSANDRAAGAVKRQVEETKKVAEANYTSAKSVNELVIKYEELQGKAKKTKEQKAELQSVMNKIADLSPNLITQYDAQGNAIGLIADAAGRAAKNLKDMTVAAGRAQSAKTFMDFEPKLQQADALREEAIGLRARLEYFNRRKKEGGSVMVAGQHVVNPLTGVSVDMPAEKINTKSQRFLDMLANDNKRLREVVTHRVSILREWKTKVQPNMKLAQQGNMLPNMPKFGPENQHPKTEYTPEGKPKKEKKGPKVADPLDQWRAYITQMAEKMYKLNNLDPLADAKWMAWNEKLQLKLDGIKTMAKLYALAADSANDLAVVEKRAAEQKSYEQAMIKVQQMGHKPKSERLGDIARFEVGDPNKDRWNSTTINNPFVPGGKVSVLGQPSYLTGNDEMKKRWRPGQKKNYIDAMEREQGRIDITKAVDQHRGLMDDILKPLEKEKSVMQQTIELVRSTPELYAQVGEMGAYWYGVVAQAAHDNAEAIKKAKDAAEEAAKKYADMWKSVEDATKDAHAQWNMLDIETTGFGEDMSREAYNAAAAYGTLGVSIEELDDPLKDMVNKLGLANMQLAEKKALKEYNEQIRQLTASIFAVTMQGGDFQKWLMETTGLTEHQIDTLGKFKGLDLDQWRNLFNVQTDADHASSLKQAIQDMKNMRVDIGLVKFASKEAEIAWTSFGTTLGKLSPTMQLEVRKLAQEMKQLDSIRKVQRIWQTAAGTLEDAFTNAFESVLTKQESFWDSFIATLRSALIRIAASEAAKEIVRLIGKITGMSNYGRENEAETPKAAGGGGNPVIAGIIAAMGSIAGANSGGGNNAVSSMSNFLGFGRAATMPQQGVQNVFVVGVAPGVMGGGIPGMPGGIPGMPGGIPGMGGGGAAGSMAAVGAMFGPVGMGIGAALDVGRFFNVFGEGGRPAPGRAAVIGDKGPEIWVPDASGTIISNEKIQQMMDGATNSSPIQVVNTGDNHYYGDADAELVAQKTANKLDRKLRLLRR